jgi:bisanhydrobacterioruberin hydratase
MERKKSLRFRAALYLIFTFGVLWHAIPYTRGIVMALTTSALLISYILVLYPEYISKNLKVIIWLLSASVITFIIEVIGTQTSLIFGNYDYGKTLGLKVAGVPLVIGFNWSFIIWGCSEAASKLKLNILIKILTAASAAVFLDFLIEPVAMYLDYWQWEGNIIPLQNYIAWFIISVIFSASYYYIKAKSRSTLPVHFYLTQIIFFGLLNLIMVWLWEF